MNYMEDLQSVLQNYPFLEINQPKKSSQNVGKLIAS